MNKIKNFIVFCLAVFLLAACGGSVPVSETESLPESVLESVSSDSIVGILWLWETVYYKDTDESATVSNPENYTIQFKEDGTFTGQADCNSISGTYSRENGFTITLEPTTLAFCGEDSLDLMYLDLLSNVVAGGPDGLGDLALETAGGERRMQFGQ
ncbi:MAG: META domain-containing protein [Candidatus Promineifilaceae bacterium]|jgi:heat shock protein HslJ